MPTQFEDAAMQAAQKFANDFCSVGGLRYIVDILKGDFLLPNVEPGLRAKIYEQALIILK